MRKRCELVLHLLLAHHVIVEIEVDIDFDGGFDIDLINVDDRVGIRLRRRTGEALVEINELGIAWVRKIS